VNDKIQAVRGMNDLLPDQIDIWHGLEMVLREVGWQYGYQEIRTPMLEKTALFKQSIGDQTDIVEKEMYTFTDSSEESLSLRPEATASTVRACIQHGLLHNQQQRFWYMGPMFRRERPQKGRYRQFHQFGVEAFGWEGPDIDAEIIRIGERIWKNLNVDGITLQINALGSESSRLAYRQALQSYLRNYSTQLDSDSIRRLENNPLRILDSKVPETIEIVANAPHVLEYLEPAERKHFDGLCESLEGSSIRYQVNSRLVRGLDYYTGTVFEWTTDQLGAQSAVCAGGRYDSLVEHRGGKPTPAIGFAMGMERLVELVAIQGKTIFRDKDSIYMIDVMDSGPSASIAIAETLRNSGYRVINHCGGGKLKSRLKRADQSGARFAIIIGESEQERGVVQLKFLRENIEQQEISQEKLVAWFDNNL
jgi:histidyl-tRNA synthetase